MSTKLEHGSTKLWRDILRKEKPSEDQLEEVVRTTPYKIINWENLGRPAIDQWLVRVEVPADQVGDFTQGILGLHGDEYKIRVNKIFPKGVVAFDGIVSELDIRRG